MSPRRISAADLGTNTLKVSHFEAGPADILTPLMESADTIRLGFGIEATGRIEPDRIERCIEILKAQEALGSALGSEAFIGVGTEAIRIASNGPELLSRIETETAWEIKLIPGDIEARLTFLGLRHEVPPNGDAVIIDIGGGSTEVVLVSQCDVTSSTSLHLGSGRLADRHFSTDPPGVASLLEASSAAQTALREGDMLPEHIDGILFSGGNGVFIKALIHQLFPGEALEHGTVERLLAHLARTPASDTAKRLDIAHERARVLPAGVAIALAFLSEIDATTVRGVQSGIRIGLVREYLDSRAGS